MTVIFCLNRDEISTLKERVSGTCQDTDTMQKNAEEFVSVWSTALMSRNVSTRQYGDCECGFVCACVLNSGSICKKSWQ